ncbi:MAG: ABC transporter substrate-binding protein [Deltaproteobacteria bacterium]|nr:ABC transporter substrate-binding protein [Deltaproteobacteria bacterium]
MLLGFSAQAQSGTLHVVTSLDPLEAKEYLKQFQAETKIAVTTIRLSAGEVVARLKAEKNNPTQSVWFGGPSLDYIAAADEKLLEPYSSAATQKIPEKFRDAKGYWTGIYFGSLGFITYKPFLVKKGLQPPLSWEDLLLPVYKNEIAVALPYTSGTGFTLYAGLVQLMGEDGALQYWKKLDKNMRHYTKSGSGPVLETALGEVGAGVAFSQDIWRKATSRGFPVSVSYPKEGTPYEIGGVAIIKGAKEKEAAQKFIDWMVSLRGQNLMHKWGRYPILPGAKTPKGLGGPTDLKLIDMNPALGLKRNLLLTRWRQTIKK